MNTHGTMPTNIPMYAEDLERLDMLVDALRARGVKRPSRAGVVRLAVLQLQRLPLEQLEELLRTMPERPK